MGELKSPGKPFDISKREVWEAREKVKANQGAPGVDGCALEEFEAGLRTCGESDHCQGLRPSAGASRRVMSPIMAHLTQASACSGRRS
jgi:hypothetical protein